MSKTPAKQPAPRFRQSDKAEKSKELTSEKIAAHVDAFRAAGGKIEVLGTTRVLTRISGVVLRPREGGSS